MSSPEPTTALKAALRRQARERRAQLPLEARTAAGEGLREQFLSAIQPFRGAIVSGYGPIEAELDPRPLLLALRNDDHRVGLPVVAGKGLPLLFREWTDSQPLENAPFGLAQPPDTAAELEPDLLIVPLLAFDRAGDRLGYGAGYYDLTLAALRRRKPVLAVGVAYAAQEVERVPRDPWDEPLDWIVTEQFAMRIGQG